MINTFYRFLFLNPPNCFDQFDMDTAFRVLDHLSVWRSIETCLIVWSILVVPTFSPDRIKRLKMRHWGKLNFTYDGKLLPPQFVPWCRSRRVPRYMTQIHLESCTSALVYCGTKSCTSALRIRCYSRRATEDVSNVMYLGTPLLPRHRSKRAPR